ncbi:TrkA-N domain-containing protein [Allopseudospirillum japonicum]|uniref:TrkA-N domain-containing protein n=1 Tax=Allopseudospirillum japonicum TaxID=64971 RepID=A0A1H6U4A8_9GAMM|nr:NAD-binding protein [Allopseudospirillum japonicum]SEI87198.1 TrkA-N domain-containing protein [Allopseudospirillum japonicum]
MSSILPNFKNFIVIVGWDKFADLVTEQLANTQRQAIALVDDQKIADRVNSTYDNQKVVAIKMDYFNIEKLKKLPLDRAFGIYVNLATDRDRLMYVFQLRKHFPELAIITPVVNQKLKESFAVIPNIFPLSRDAISAKIFASHLFKQDVATYLNELLSPATCDKDHKLRQYKILADNPLCNEMYGDAFIKVKQDYNAVLVGISKRTAEGKYELRKNPTDETLVQKNDYLIILVNEKSAQALEQAFGIVTETPNDDSAPL